ncbi:hypothetical protein GCM10017687_81990 [Streptomyces echinatus]
MEKDLLTADNDGSGVFTIPRHPVRRRLHGVERFVTTLGGEYFFLPSLSALRWLADPGACPRPHGWGSPVSGPVLGCTWVTGSTSRIAWPWFHRCPGPPRHRVRSGAPVRQEGWWAHMARAPSGGHAGERQSPRPDGRERAGHTGPEDRR